MSNTHTLFFEPFGRRITAETGTTLFQAALTNGIPYFTTVAGAVAVTEAIGALTAGQLEVAPLQSYFKGSFA